MALSQARTAQGAPGGRQVEEEVDDDGLVAVRQTSGGWLVAIVREQTLPGRLTAPELSLQLVL